MGALKRKLKSLSGDAAADSTPSTPKTPKTPGTGGRKRTAGTKDTPNEESPTKKLKGGKKAPAKGKGDDTFLQGGYDLDDDEEVKPMAMGTGSVVKKEEVDDEIQIV